MRCDNQYAAPIPCGLVVRIRGFHPRGPGSIPGTGIKFLLLYWQSTPETAQHAMIVFAYVHNCIEWYFHEMHTQIRFLRQHIPPMVVKAEKIDFRHFV